MILQLICEVKYTDALDTGFKKFLDNKNRSNTEEEKQENRASNLVDTDLVKKAKEYRCVKYLSIYFVLVETSI